MRIYNQYENNAKHLPSAQKPQGSNFQDVLTETQNDAKFQSITETLLKGAPQSVKDAWSRAQMAAGNADENKPLGMTTMRFTGFLERVRSGDLPYGTSGNGEPLFLGKTVESAKLFAMNALRYLQDPLHHDNADSTKFLELFLDELNKTG